MERKVYSSYAFTENEREKSKINREIYNELMKKWRVSDSLTVYDSGLNERVPINKDDFDFIYTRKPEYRHGEYTIIKNETDMSPDEIALICDGGNLCFGYKKESSTFFYVFED